MIAWMVELTAEKTISEVVRMFLPGLSGVGGVGDGGGTVVVGWLWFDHAIQMSSPPTGGASFRRHTVALEARSRHGGLFS